MRLIKLLIKYNISPSAIVAVLINILIFLFLIYRPDLWPIFNHENMCHEQKHKMWPIDYRKAIDEYKRCMNEIR